MTEKEFPQRDVSLLREKEITYNHYEHLMHHVYDRFVEIAHLKLKKYVYQNLDKDDDLSKPFKKGADPEFDNALRCLCVVSKHDLKRMVDSVMYWRKTKIDELNLLNIPDHM